MSDAVKKLQPDAQQVVMHYVGARDLGKYLLGEPIPHLSIAVDGAFTQRPVESDWYLIGVFQEHTGKDPFGGGTYCYRVIWAKAKSLVVESAIPR